MIALTLTLLLTAAAQEAPAPEPSTSDGPAPEVAAPDGPAPEEPRRGEDDASAAPADPTPGEPGEGAAGEPEAPGEASEIDADAPEASPPAPWAAPPDALRRLDGAPVVGPWPDGWSPDEVVRDPQIDLITGEIREAEPYGGISNELGPFPAPPTEEAEAGEALGGTAGPEGEATDDTGEPGDAGDHGSGDHESADAPDELEGRGEEDTTGASGAHAPPTTEATDEPGADASAEGRPPDERGAARTDAPRIDAAPAGPVAPAPAWRLLPPEAGDGPEHSLPLALGGFAALIAASLSRRGLRWLRPDGLLPSALRWAGLLGRALGALLICLSIFALTPWSWAGPFILLAAALAGGWTLRDLIADLFAGLILLIDRSFEPGQRLELDGQRGVLELTGARVSRIQLDDGRALMLPNRSLLTRQIHLDPDPWPAVEVPVHVPWSAHSASIRQTLEELALLSPYLAPDHTPHAYRDPDREDIWVVEARLVHARYAADFRGALVEEVDESFREG